MNKILLLACLASLAASPALAIPTYADKDEIVYRTNLGRADDVALLIKKGVSPDQTNKDGVPLISLAVVRADPEGARVLQTLVEQGANINAADNNGQTALFYAARTHNLAAVNFLLEHKIDYYAADKGGDIARNIAYRAGYQDVVEAMDNFVRNQTQQVTKQYEDLNKSLEERYKEMEKNEAPAPEDTTTETPVATDTPAPAPVAEPVRPRKNKQEAPEFVVTPEFEKDMADLALQSCRFQYWTYVHDVKQSNELGDKITDTIDSLAEKVKSLTKQATEAHKLPATYAQTIANNAKQKIFQELDGMPSNIYRHEQGVGKSADMEARCKLVTRSWDVAPPPVAKREDTGSDEAAPTKKGGKGGGKKGGKNKKGGSGGASFQPAAPNAGMATKPRKGGKKTAN